MLASMSASSIELRLFQSTPHPCGYWPLRTARDLVIDPDDPRLEKLYPHGLGWGFRRSGNLLYRPQCPDCQACVPVRIDCERFVPNRSQRRCLKRNADLRWQIIHAQRSDEQLALYQRYLAARHPGGGMDKHTAADYDRFLLGDWSQTRFMEIRGPDHAGNDALLAVAVTDVTVAGLSAVYTYYDPRSQARALGTYAILQQLQWARSRQLPHLYLGYWIAGHAKMAYKRGFSALQAYDGQHWHPLPDDRQAQQSA